MAVRNYVALKSRSSVMFIGTTVGAHTRIGATINSVDDPQSWARSRHAYPSRPLVADRKGGAGYARRILPSRLTVVRRVVEHAEGLHG